MSGAFVAVADDATTTWWNPAGLASGGYFNAIIEFDRVEDPSGTRARAFALNVPSLGLSYYRLSLNGMRPSDPTESPPANREDQGVLSQFGATVGQSIGAHLILAIHAETGARARATPRPTSISGPWRLLGRLRARRGGQEPPDAGVLGRRRRCSSCRVRCGRALRSEPGRPTAPRSSAAVDADLTTTPTAFGDARHLATGVEAWLAQSGGRASGRRRDQHRRGDPAVRQRGGERRAAWAAFTSTPSSPAGPIEARNGWGFALRVTF